MREYTGPKVRLLSIVIALMAAVAAAPVGAEEIYIPAVAQSSGQEGAFWISDLSVKAIGSEITVVRVELLERGKDNTHPERAFITLKDDGSVSVNNVLEDLFGFQGTGALRLTPVSGEVIASSRTYNAYSRIGQSVPGIPEGDAFRFGETATLLQLSQSTRPPWDNRTNIGFVNLSPYAAEIVIDFLYSTGVPKKTIIRRLKPFEPAQISTDLPGSWVGYAQIRTTTPDARFLAYASVVDNTSGDPVLILGQRDIPVLAAPALEVPVNLAFYSPDVDLAGLQRLVLRADLEFIGASDIYRDENVDFDQLITTPERADGGSTASPRLRTDITGLDVHVPANETLAVDEFPVYFMSDLSQPPLSWLRPENGGVDLETGNDFIRQALWIEFVGATSSGRPVRSEPLRIHFNFYWED